MPLYPLPSPPAPQPGTTLSLRGIPTRSTGVRRGAPEVLAGTVGEGVCQGLYLQGKGVPGIEALAPSLAPTPSPREQPSSLVGLMFHTVSPGGGGLGAHGGWQEYRVSISPGTIHTIVLLTSNH